MSQIALKKLKRSGLWVLTLIVAIISTLLIGDTARAAPSDPPIFERQWGYKDTRLAHPYGIAVDAAGNIYVTDESRDLVKKFNSDGVFERQWGSSGSGEGQFNFPQGIAVDGAGNVYVAEYYNNRIQKFNSNGEYISQWGSEGTGDGQFDNPVGVAVDGAGNVYVADNRNNRIQKFNSDGEYISQWGSGGTGEGQFDFPKGVAVDGAGNVYVADSFNHRIQKFDSDGEYLDQWGSFGDGDGQFFQPEGVAVDGAGNIYVADYNNGRIQKLDSDGNYLSRWGDEEGNDGEFNTPGAVAVSGPGNVYVADTLVADGFGKDRIQKFDSNGTYLSQWIGDGRGGMAVDGAGNVYAVDTYGPLIQKFNSDGDPLGQWGSAGSEEGQFNEPKGIAVDSAGNVYVADTKNNRIQKFNSDNEYVTQWGSGGGEEGQFSWPEAIAVDSAGNIYVADTSNHRIQKFNSDNEFVTQWGSEGTGDGQFDYPEGIAVDGAGNVYVADNGNHRIQKFNSDGDYLTQWGGRGNGNGQFEYPVGVAVDAAGNIYVLEGYDNHRIQKFTYASLLLVSPESLSFDATEGEANPAGQVITVTHSGEVALEWTATKGQTWVNLSEMSGTTPSTPLVTVDITGLSAGVHTDTITLSVDGVPAVQVQVTLNIASAPPPVPQLYALPESLVFNAAQGGANPAGQDVAITYSGEEAVDWTATKSQPWTILSAMSGTTPSNITVDVDITGLSVGVYSDTLIFSAADVAPVQVLVTLNITEEEEIELPITLHVDSGSTSMQLSWNVTNDPYVTHYRIWRSPVDDQNLELLVDNYIDTTYFDEVDETTNPLQEGTTYCYLVEAINEEGEISIVSNVACGVYGLLDLWVPDTIAKPGDEVIISINVRNAQGLGISASDIWMDFDPTVLTALSISRTALTADYAWSHHVEAINATTSRVRIAYIHPEQNEVPPLLYGEGSLFWINFQVNGDPGSTSPMDLKEFIQGVGGTTIYDKSPFNEAEIRLTDGLFTVEGEAKYKLGDVNGDAIVSAVDSALALFLSTGARPPTTFEKLAADVNGNDAIDPPDSSMILYYAAHDEWPPVPPASSTDVAAASFGITHADATSSVQIGQLRAKQGANAQASISGSGLVDVAGATFSIVYDRAVVEEVVEVRKGALTSDFDSLEFTDSGNGLLTIALAGDVEVDGAGELVVIVVKLAANAPVGTTSLRLADAKLNNLLGQDFVTSAAANALNRQSSQIVVDEADNPDQDDPVLSVTPATLSFAAQVNGANPAAKSFAIANTGEGTLNWSASDDAPWLTLSAASGTAPATVNVTANIAGLAVGTHNGVITVTAAGAEGSPKTVAVTLVVQQEPVVEEDEKLYLPSTSKVK